MSPSNEVLAAGAPDIYEIRTRAPGPAGSLPFTEEMLLHRPSGDLFGLTTEWRGVHDAQPVDALEFPDVEGGHLVSQGQASGRDLKVVGPDHQPTSFQVGPDSGVS